MQKSNITMKILIVGAGKMGSWLAEVLGKDHEVAVLDNNPGHQLPPENKRLKKPGEVASYNPDMLVNAVPLNKTIKVFGDLMGHLHYDTLIGDMASVKNGLAQFYKSCGFRFVSTHPMFGPTFADMKNLRHEHAIIIEESDPEGKAFFRQLFKGLRIQVHQMTFREHDINMASSLSKPFLLSLLFGSTLDQNIHPGTTYAKHHQIIKGLISEDDTLLSEVLMNKASLETVNLLQNELQQMKELIEKEDKKGWVNYIQQIRSWINSKEIG
jgi:prephenate dehydrogenase